MDQPLNIKEMSVVQLKSLCFDQLVLIEQSQNNLKVLNQEIALRNQPIQGQNIIAEIPIKKGN